MATNFTCFNFTIIMNKLLKCAFGLITAFALSFTCYSNAGLIKSSSQEYIGSQNDKTYVNNSCDMICINPDGANCNNINLAFNLNHSQYAWSIHGVGDIGNTYGFCTSEHTVYFSSFDGCNFTIDCYNFTEYTSLQCQTEYNLIPISEVTANYCALNFGMIDPQECPINEGTGAVNRSARYINNQQYPGTASLQIRIPEFIKYSITYNTDETEVDIEGYNADEDYINNIIDNEKLTPTNEDFTNMLTGGMVNFFAYMAIAVLFFYLAKVIYKLFK